MCPEKRNGKAKLIDKKINAFILYRFCIVRENGFSLTGTHHQEIPVILHSTTLNINESR